MAQSGRELLVELLEDFNYERVLKGGEVLTLNPERNSFVDSDAVDFLYNLKLKGRRYRISNSPPLLRRVAKVLKVEV